MATVECPSNASRFSDMNTLTSWHLWLHIGNKHLLWLDMLSNKKKKDGVKCQLRFGIGAGDLSDLHGALMEYLECKAWTINDSS